MAKIWKFGIIFDNENRNLFILFCFWRFETVNLFYDVMCVPGMKWFNQHVIGCQNLYLQAHNFTAPANLRRVSSWYYRITIIGLYVHYNSYLSHGGHGMKLTVQKLDSVDVSRMVESEDCVGPGIVTLCGPGHHRMDFCSQERETETNTSWPLVMFENRSLLLRLQISHSIAKLHISVTF